MEPLSEEAIRYRTDSKVFARGVDYWENESVLSLVKRAQSLHAKVEGSDIKPYRVTVTWEPDGSVEANCNCPYGEEWDGWCKHIVAVLLAYEAKQFEEQPPLEELLDPLSSKELIELIMAATKRDPAVYDAIISTLNGEPSDDEEDDLYPREGW